MATQIFKCTLGDDIRRLRATPTTDALFAALTDAFHPVTDFLVYWQDEDGDFITIKTTEDLAEACLAAAGSTVRLLIKTAGAAEPTVALIKAAQVTVEVATEKGVAMAKTIFGPHWPTLTESTDGKVLKEIRQSIKDQVQQARGQLKCYLQKAREASKSAVEVAHASLQAFDKTVEELRTKGHQLCEARKQDAQAMKQAAKAKAAKAKAKKAAASKEKKAAKAMKQAAAKKTKGEAAQPEQPEQPEQPQQQQPAAAAAAVAAAAAPFSGLDEETALMILAAMGPGCATQCPACSLIIEKIDGDDTMMCGCEGRPAGGTMEKALAGGGCGHEFNFETLAPIGQGKPGAPANDRQWKFFVPELMAEEEATPEPEPEGVAVAEPTWQPEIVTCNLSKTATVSLAEYAHGQPATSSVQVIVVGASEHQSVKVVELPGPGFTVSPFPINPQEDDWTDQFDVTVDGTTLTVRRIDAEAGWGQQLELVATNEQPPHDDEAAGGGGAMPVPEVEMACSQPHDGAAVEEGLNSAVAILRAWYGQPTMEHFQPGPGGVDLTEIAEGYVTADGLRFQMPASNKVGGDPAVGVRKVLVVEYRDPAGERQTATAWEGSAIEVDVMSNTPIDHDQAVLAGNTDGVDLAEDTVATPPPSESPPDWGPQLEVLEAMGFAGACLVEMLAKRNGSIEQVIDDLM